MKHSTKRPAAVQPDDLSWTTYQVLARAFGVDWRSLRREWRVPGSVRGRAGFACRDAIASLAGLAKDGGNVSR